jgi:hypothetical protein
MKDIWLWLTVALLGAYHGINPAMGWLFAVALGLQERRRATVLRAFAPIALGHAVSIAAVVLLLGAAQALVDLGVLRLIGAGALILFGLYKLLAPMSHPRWVGMRVNFRDLTAWSFLMATAHGAGLMLMPVLLRLPSGVAYAAQGAPAHAGHAMHADHMQMAGAAAAPTIELVAVAIHTAAMFLVMAAIALVVFEKVGVVILRRAWVNLDLVWAVALIATGGLSLLL